MRGVAPSPTGPNQKSGQESPETFPAVPLADVDVFEDEGTLINRLYYAMPSFTQGRLRCSFYCEENVFRKTADGDLVLVSTKRGAEP